jgi:lipoyl(octanoyl) transferase
LSALSFRLLDTPPAPGAWNMALDAALMDSVRAGAAPVLRFYRWDPACLSLGRNQPARGCYDLEAIRDRGLDVVRRPTGGRAVLHRRELTYAAILPDRLLGGPRQSYATVNRALARGLRLLGVEAALQPRGRKGSPVPSLTPCFQEPAEGEVVVHGRKLVGSAQYRERGVILQHGSLLLEDDQGEIGPLLREPAGPDSAWERPATLCEVLDPLPSWAELARALADGWDQELNAGLEPTPPTAPEQRRAAILNGHYEDPAWTWRY